MTSKNVIDIYTKLEDLGVLIWIDGGWAVDALLGRVTRCHSDLDIAVERKNLTKLAKYMEIDGYKKIERSPDKMWDLVLSDNNGREIDIHAFEFDVNNNIIEEDDWAGYRNNSFSGKGIIDGNIVRCVSVEHLMRTYDETKRELKVKDYEDMEKLKNKLGSEIN